LTLLLRLIPSLCLSVQAEQGIVPLGHNLTTAELAPDGLCGQVDSERMKGGVRMESGVFGGGLVAAGASAADEMTVGAQTQPQVLRLLAFVAVGAWRGLRGR